MRAEEILTSAGKFHIELGLTRILKILELLGNLQKDLKFIHVAGSNGKGSTCAILEEILVKAGYKTGKFTSPHLFSYTERITVNKHPISDLDFETIINKIVELDKKNNIELTEFEILTAAGFLYFKEKACDIVILEVGLGGRLDSTNVIENPLVSIITSISLEHKERLGDTIEKIAKEKAGIIKKGRPVVFLEENRGCKILEDEALKKDGIIFKTKAISVKNGCAILSLPHYTGKTTLSDVIDDISISKSAAVSVKFNLKGKHQGENLALALKTVEILNTKGFKIDQKTIMGALETVRWKFRLDEINYNGNKILIDSCHNPDGARVLSNYLNENYKGKKIKFIFGCLKNKDYGEVLEYLLSSDTEGKDVKKPDIQRKLFFYEFDYPNALKYEDFIKNIRADFKPLIEKTDYPKIGITGKDFDLTVVCGSIYMLGLLFKDFPDFNF